MNDQIAALEREIAKHRNLYYNNDAPELTDAEYDGLVRQLRALYPESHLFQEIGGEPTLDTEKVRHVRQLLSLANAFNAEEVTRFLQKLPSTALVYTEYKIDDKYISLDHI